MKKSLKQIGVFLLVLIMLLLTFVLISYINHRIQLSREDELFVQIVALQVKNHSCSGLFVPSQELKLKRLALRQRVGVWCQCVPILTLTVILAPFRTG
ncbi:MAG TPA: hypothetical protein DDW87_04380 [Firmicutes bacterium]|nr:hypothetical protein [Bacillota bacterium]